MTRISRARTLIAGLAGGLAFSLGTFVTFRLFGGSQKDATGLLFDPDTQHPKVITVWKELEPLPRVLETPLVVLVGFFVFGLAYAFLYRWIEPGLPNGLHRRAARLSLIIWLGTVFGEFMGPFNTMHQPLRVSVIAWAMWAVCAIAEGYAVVAIAGRDTRFNSRITLAVGPDTRPSCGRGCGGHPGPKKPSPPGTAPPHRAFGVVDRALMASVAYRPRVNASQMPPPTRNSPLTLDTERTRRLDRNRELARPATTA